MLDPGTKLYILRVSTDCEDVGNQRSLCFSPRFSGNKRWKNTLRGKQFGEILSVWFELSWEPGASPVFIVHPLTLPPPVNISALLPEPHKHNQPEILTALIPLLNLVTIQLEWATLCSGAADDELQSVWSEEGEKMEAIRICDVLVRSVKLQEKSSAMPQLLAC